MHNLNNKNNENEIILIIGEEYNLKEYSNKIASIDIENNSMFTVNNDFVLLVLEEGKSKVVITNNDEQRKLYILKV